MLIGTFGIAMNDSVLEAQDFQSLGLPELFLREVVRLHGLPRTIVSDLVPQFGSTFWQQVCSQFGIDRRMPTAFHPQTDGQPG